MIGRILGFLVLALAALAPAHAQDAKWHTKPVRFIVPFPPGGSVDPLARLIGARLSSSLGQQFIVDNQEEYLSDIFGIAALSRKYSPE